MDAKCMSPEELRALADLKEKEAKIVKMGFLKQDLYDYPTECGFGGVP